MEWSRDPRCTVKYGTLAHRIAQNWNADQAITQPNENRERVYNRPQRTIEAFGETKSIPEWANDPRVVVTPTVFLRRIQHGWSTDSSLTTPTSSTRDEAERNLTTYAAFGEEKSLRDWAKDDRCPVSEMTLRKNLHSGMPIEEALQYRRKPGRQFIGAHEDFSSELRELAVALQMLGDGGELWVYETADLNRISLIHRDVRHTVAADLFKELHDGKLITMIFQTDTIKNFELTRDDDSAVA